MRGGVVAKLGRKELPFNPEVFEALCKIHCTEPEVASVMGMSPRTLERCCRKVYGLTFGDIYRQFASAGKASLRREMWHQALKIKDRGMMIYLSKNHLG